MDNEEPRSIQNLAVRMLQARGYRTDALESAAKSRQAEWTKAALKAALKAAEETGETPKTPETIWLINSSMQLQRFFGGRCITCAHWQPMDDGGNCPRLMTAETDGDIFASKSAGHPIWTSAPFGCVLWEQIDPTDSETLQDRATRAMAIGLIDPMPIEEKVGE